MFVRYSALHVDPASVNDPYSETTRFATHLEPLREAGLPGWPTLRRLRAACAARDARGCDELAQLGPMPLPPPSANGD
jgi:hypothetical protein